MGVCKGLYVDLENGMAQAVKKAAVLCFCKGQFQAAAFDGKGSGGSTRDYSLHIHSNYLKTTKSAPSQKVRIQNDYTFFVDLRQHQTAAGSRSIGIIVPPPIPMTGRSTV